MPDGRLLYLGLQLCPLWGNCSRTERDANKLIGNATVGVGVGLAVGVADGAALGVFGGSAIGLVLGVDAGLNDVMAVGVLDGIYYRGTNRQTDRQTQHTRAHTQVHTLTYPAIHTDT
jgi:hypothetical protein